MDPGAPLIPNALFFSLKALCKKGIKLPQKKGTHIPAKNPYTIASTDELHGLKSGLSISAGWNDNGIGFTFSITGKKNPVTKSDEFHSKMEGIHLWLDTRNTKNIHRANRFCHYFLLTPCLAGAPGGYGKTTRHRQCQRENRI